MSLQTSLPSGPEHLLQVIRCNYQTDCSTLRCSCKKHNNECSLACGNCKGTGCTNNGMTMVLTHLSDHTRESLDSTVYY